MLPKRFEASLVDQLAFLGSPEALKGIGQAVYDEAGNVLPIHMFGGWTFLRPDSPLPQMKIHLRHQGNDRPAPRKAFMVSDLGETLHALRIKHADVNPVSILAAREIARRHKIAFPESGVLWYDCDREQLADVIRRMQMAICEFLVLPARKSPHPEVLGVGAKYPPRNE